VGGWVGGANEGGTTRRALGPPPRSCGKGSMGDVDFVRSDLRDL
jgi:hypothetical protein